MKLKAPLILASHSPRRQQLMRELGLEFTIEISNADESFPAEIAIPEVPTYLARKKALPFKEKLQNEIVITADTIVASNNRILDKPRNKDDARKILGTLSGKSHFAYTGVCLLYHKKCHVVMDRTEVIFKKLSAGEIDYYIQHYMPLDKAGAYGIQEWIGMIGIEKIIGSYFNVVGLPVNKVYGLLQKLNLIEW